MKYTLTYSNFDEETKVSTTTISTVLGHFTATAKFNPEDKYISSYLGCWVAEVKAYKKALKMQRKNLILQQKTLESFQKKLSQKEKDSYAVQLVEKEILNIFVDIINIEKDIKDLDEIVERRLTARENSLDMLEKKKQGHK
jgi:hypothetical protein